MGAMDARRHQGPRPPSVKDSLGRREGSGLVRSGPRPRREKLRQFQVLEPGDIARRHFGETTMLLRAANIIMVLAFHRPLRAPIIGALHGIGENDRAPRSEEHTSELQSLMRIS